jgi:hypothetical protein
MITTAETVRYGVRTETGCWYEADHEVLDLDEATKVGGENDSCHISVSPSPPHSG